MSGSVETRTKRSLSMVQTRLGAPLSRSRGSRAAQARLPRPIRVRPACWSSHESHRPALELQRATVRGAPSLRSAVHPPTALVCWQVRGPRTAPMAAVLRHHPGGARQAAQACSVGESGACPHHSPASRYHHAAHPQAALCAWQETIGRCAGSCSSWLPSGSVRQWRGGGQELAPSAVPMPRCAPRPGKARARGPDGGWSSSRLTPAAWPVRPDPLPSWGGFGAPG